MIGRLRTDAKTPNPAEPGAIRLVIADVDGTLITSEKVLTPRTHAAVRALLEAGIAFTITSGRPPRGMKPLVDALALVHLIAAFNGGVLANPDLSIIRQYFLPAAVSRRVLEIIAAHALDTWLYTDKDWFVPDAHGPHVEREAGTVKFSPSVVAGYDALLDRAVKIVGVSDDLTVVARCEADVRRECGKHVSASRSQPYYLDVTHPDANKGMVVHMLSELLKVQASNIATIGDGPNDILMFRKSGMSIAMGQSRDEVKRAANSVTASNDEDGFALAMERFILPGHRST